MDAFEVMRKAAKRKSGSSPSSKVSKGTNANAKVPKTARPELIECPLCRFTFRKTAIDHHTSTCSQSKQLQHSQSPSTSSVTVNASVHDYFGGIDTSVPTFFLLTLPSQPQEEFLATFSRSKPLDAVSIDLTFQWQKKTIHLYTSETVDQTTVSDLPPSIYTNIPFLKSHLQVRHASNL